MFSTHHCERILNHFFLEKVQFVACFFRNIMICVCRGWKPNESKYTALRLDIMYTATQCSPGNTISFVLNTYAAGTRGFRRAIWSNACTPLKTRPSFFFNMLLICKLFILNQVIKQDISVLVYFDTVVVFSVNKTSYCVG